MVITVIGIVAYVIIAGLAIGALLVNLHASHRYRYYRTDYILMALGITAGMSILTIGK